MGIEEKQYPIFTMLKKRVLDVAVKELNEKTDISVSYELERYGRKVTNIHFAMSPKNEALPVAEAQEEIRKKLISYGLKEKKIEALLSNHNEQYLWANIAIVEEQAAKGNIKDITAYLLKAFSDDYRAAETEFAKQQKQIAADHEQREKNIQEAEQQKKNLEQQFIEERNAQFDAVIGSLDATTKAALEKDFSDMMLASQGLALIFKTKGRDNPIIDGQRKKFIVERFLAKEYWNFENYGL